MPLLEGAVEPDTQPAQAPVSLPTRMPERPAGTLDAPLDVVFPVLHGTYGEDGTIQGLLDLADVAYVGSGVTGSAVGMDKAIQKRVLHAHGIPVAPSRVYTRRAWRASPDSIRAEIETELGYPVFVKPCNLGSSVGISKVHSADELGPAMDFAARYDRRLIVEAGIPNAREIEVSVLGNDEPEASVCGEIIPATSFTTTTPSTWTTRHRSAFPLTFRTSWRRAFGAWRWRPTAPSTAPALRAWTFCSTARRSTLCSSRSTRSRDSPRSASFPSCGAPAASVHVTCWTALIELALERHADRRETSTSYD